MSPPPSKRRRGKGNNADRSSISVSDLQKEVDKKDEKIKQLEGELILEKEKNRALIYDIQYLQKSLEKLKEKVEETSRDKVNVNTFKADSKKGENVLKSAREVVEDQNEIILNGNDRVNYQTKLQNLNIIQGERTSTSTYTQLTTIEQFVDSTHHLATSSSVAVRSGANTVTTGMLGTMPQLPLPQFPLTQPPASSIYPLIPSLLPQGAYAPYSPGYAFYPRF